jgi:hypothetical protein
MMRDIPLANAVIVANRGRAGTPTVVAALRHADPAIAGYEFTTGAGEEPWDGNPDHRLGLLYEAMWFLAHVFEIPTDLIHTAVQAIPEYRSLAGNGLPGRAFRPADCE